MIWMFHGTVAESVRPIEQEGVRTSEAEPNFTTDLSLAVLKYAHRGFNTRRLYGGQTAREARALAESGVVPPSADPDGELQAARAWWEANDDSGRVYGVVSGTPPPRPHAAELTIDAARREVRGGLTKWIEDHRYVQPATPGTTHVIPPAELGICITGSPSIRDVLARMTGRSTGTYPTPALHAVACTELRGSLRSCAGIDVDGIVRQTRRASIATAIRRGALSAMRSAGYRLIKADFSPPYEEDDHVFWPRATVSDRLAALREHWRRFRDEYGPFTVPIDALHTLHDSRGDARVAAQTLALLSKIGDDQWPGSS